MPKRLWLTLADYGLELFHHEADRTIHRISNRVLLYSLLINTFSIFLYCFYLTKFSYSSALLLFCFLAVLLEGLMIVVFMLKLRGLSGLSYLTSVIITYSVGFVYVALIGLSLGAEAGGVYYIFGLLPLPFFFLGRQNLSLIIVLEAFSGGAAFLLHHVGLPTMINLVLEPQVSNHLYIMLNLLQYVGIPVSVYFFWVISVRP